MKKLTRIILMIMLLNTLSSATELVFGTYPHKSNKLLYEQYKPLLEHLKHTLNQPVKFTIARDYNNLIELLVNNKVQIAVLGPYNYIKAMQEDKNIQYIATQQYLSHGEMISSYYAVIVSSKQSGITKLSSLKGKRFAFTDFNSTSGYLFPNLIFKANGLSKNDFDEIFMLKKHSHVMEALTHNSIDAGATHYENYLSYVKTYGNQYNILYKSESIPYDAVVVSSFVAKKEKQSIENAFLSYKETINGKEVLGYIKKDKSIYDEIKKKAKKL